MFSCSFFEIAYRQKAHLVGVPDFKWLEKYQQNIGRKSFLNTGEDDALINLIRAVIKGQAGICLATMSVASSPLLTERTMKLLRKLNNSQIPHCWGLLCQPSFAVILFVGLAGANALVGSESNSNNLLSLDDVTFIGSQKNLLVIQFPTYWSKPATGNLSDSPG